MTTLQKAIKYFAIVFAIFLTVNIIGGIVMGIGMASSIFTDSSDYSGKSEIVEIKNVNISNIDNLDLDINYAKLSVRVGSEYKIESSEPSIEAYQDDDTLKVKDKNRWFRNAEYEIILTIPADKLFKDITIHTGAGRVQFEKINTYNFDFQVGARKATVQELNVIDNCKLEGGAGQISILGGSINNLKLDMGVGAFSLTALLTGNNKISAGIGKLELDILADIEEYSLKSEKGIGSIKINGSNVSNNYSYGNGINYIDIEGGIGSIDINFNE